MTLHNCKNIVWIQTNDGTLMQGEEPAPEAPEWASAEKGIWYCLYYI